MSLLPARLQIQDPAFSIGEPVRPATSEVKVCPFAAFEKGEHLPQGYRVSFSPTKEATQAVSIKLDMASKSILVKLKKPMKAIPQQAPTIKEAQNALTEVLDKLGLESARDLLFKVTGKSKLFDVPEEMYKDLIEAARSKLDQHQSDRFGYPLKQESKA